MLNFDEDDHTEQSLRTDESVDQSVNLSVLDLTQSASIRSSKRRVKKGSAVVLNTDRLLKYIQSSTNGGESNHQSDRAGSSQSNNGDDSKESLNSSADRKSAASTIEKIWQNFLARRGLRYCQFGKWTAKQSDRLFALILGHRVRYLLCHGEIGAKLKSYKDLCSTLGDICANAASPKTARTLGQARSWYEFYEQIAGARNIDDLLFKYPALSHTDLVLAKTMCKQILSERQKIYNLIFGECRWVSYPSPGYWDFSSALELTQQKEMRMAAQQQRSEVVSSPARNNKGLPNVKNMETPPNFRSALRHANKAPQAQAKLIVNKGMDPDLYDEIHEAAEKGYDGGLAQHRDDRNLSVDVDNALPDRVHILHSNVKPRKPRESPFAYSPERRSDAVNDISTGNIPKRSSPESAAPLPKRFRSTDGAHLQIEIVSGEKLMPARKGPSIRDANGEPVPDRKPGLKVQLWLPPYSSSSNYSNVTKKKVCQESRDFMNNTLNPVWNSSFVLALPCPRNVVCAIASSEARQCLNPGGSSLSDEGYETICKQLMEWWSHGLISIEVIDGERFNQEIFMGQVEIFLAGFMFLLKKPDDLEIKGTFQLCKSAPTDRVSGSIKLAMYLHIPEKSHIEKLLFGTSSKAVSSKSDASPPQPHSNHATRHAPNSSDLYSSPEPPPPPPSHPAAPYVSKFMQELIGKHSPSNNDEEQQQDIDAVLEVPTLDDSINVNYKFDPNENNIRNIAESARLLKEKIRKSRHGRSRRENTEKTTMEETIQGTSDQDKSKIDTDYKQSIRQSGIPVRKSGSSKAVDNSVKRRLHMDDVTRQLANLSVVQHSAEEILGNLNQQLEIKLQSKYREQEQSASKSEEHRAHSNIEAEDEVAHSGLNDHRAKVYLSNGEDDVSEDLIIVDLRKDFDGMRPNQVQLQSSLRSSHEDNDAPEMGDTDANEDYSDYEADWGEGEYGNLGIQDHELEFFDARESSPHRQESDTSSTVIGSDDLPLYEQEPVEGRAWVEAHEEDANSVGSGGYRCDSDNDNVQYSAAKRNNHRIGEYIKAGMQHTSPYGRSFEESVPVDTIYYSDHDEVHQDYDNDGEGADIDFSRRANMSNSTIYSTTVQEFLSPDYSKHHTSMRNQSIPIERDDDCFSELIVQEENDGSAKATVRHEGRFEITAVSSKQRSDDVNPSIDSPEIQRVVLELDSLEL